MGLHSLEDIAGLCKALYLASRCLRPSLFVVNLDLSRITDLLCILQVQDTEQA